MDDLIGGEWLAWKHHPKTREFMQLLNEQVEAMKDGWLSGDFVAGDASMTAAVTLRNLGRAESFAKVIDVIENIRLNNDEEQSNG